MEFDDAFNHLKNDEIKFWDMATNPYMYDKEIMNLTAYMGIFGGFAILISSLFYSNKYRKNILDFEYKKIHYENNNHISQTFSIWFLWLIFGFIILIISSSPANIFQSKYQYAGLSFLSRLNFNSSWMFGFGFFIYSYIDILFTKSLKNKKIKFILFSIFILFYVIWFQIFRGDRESLTLIIGLVIFHIVYVNNPKKIIKKRKIPYLPILVFIFILLSVNFIITITRSNVLNEDFNYLFNIIIQFIEFKEVQFKDIFTGTWSAALLTPISVAGDYKNELLNFRLGKDYLDIFLSLPPGFIADIFQYQRPFENYSGPAYQMRYGQGGTHASIFPFRNFNSYGIFIIMFFLNTVFINYEIKLFKNYNSSNSGLILFCLVFFPHWIWYGDKYLINFLIGYLIINFLYKISRISK